MAKAQTVTIKPLRKKLALIHIVGTAPYVQNKFSRKALEQMHATQEAGSQAGSKRKREPKDFKAACEGATHVSGAGWRGIPAPAFRAAMIEACRLVGFKMTFAKCSLFIKADGIDPDDGTPLVRIDGEPEYSELAVRNDNGSVDLRARPMWREWSATVRVVFDEDQFSFDDVVNLMERAGQQIGIGEGRPFSKNSHGMGWGTFEVAKEAA